MKFFSPTSQPLSVGLTSGHMAVVAPAPEGSTLDPMFHREAVARGAIPESMLTLSGGNVAAAAAESAQQRQQAVRDAITAMLDGGEEGDFNDDGKPNLTKLNAKVGFKVPREEADAIFAELTQQS